MLYTIHTIPIHPFTVYTNLFRPYPLSTFLFTLNSPHSSSSFIQPFSVCILYLYSLFYPSLSFILFSVISVLILYPLLCYFRLYISYPLLRSIRPYPVSSSLLILNSPHTPSSFIQPFSVCILYYLLCLSWTVIIPLPEFNQPFSVQVPSLPSCSLLFLPDLSFAVLISLVSFPHHSFLIMFLSHPFTLLILPLSFFTFIIPQSHPI